MIDNLRHQAIIEQQKMRDRMKEMKAQRDGMENELLEKKQNLEKIKREQEAAAKVEQEAKMLADRAALD